MTKNSTGVNKVVAQNNSKDCSCEECLENLYLMVDGEASRDQEEFFKKHMDVCSPCFDSYSIEKSVKEFIHSRIDRKPVPQSVIDTIKSKIALLA